MKFLKIHKQISIDAAVSGFLGYTECQVTNDAYRKPCNKGDQYLLKQSTVWSFAFDRTECQCVQSSTRIDPVSSEKKNSTSFHTMYGHFCQGEIGGF